MRNTLVVQIGALLLAAACADIPSAVNQTLHEPSFLMECPFPDAQGNCPPTEGAPYPPALGPWDDGALYQAPGDPNPTAPGVWLGELVSPFHCYGTQDPYLFDADKDWLADHCEPELARAFAPRMHFTFDSCGTGEPYWAAKFFTSGYVRLAYMPAYYRDCGSYGHIGDSEFIMVEVKFNATTRHWELVSMFLSAHHGSPNHQSEWPTAANVEFKTRALAFPTVWVAQNKHANYKSAMNCNSGEQYFYDTCHSTGYFPTRFPVVTSRNAGSRHVDLLGGCPASAVDPIAHPGRESFYYRGDACTDWVFNEFNGWHTSRGGGTSYYAWLMSELFELRADPYYPYFGSADWGPGPTPPPPLSVRIAGRTEVEADELARWTAVVSSGRAPFTHTWRIGTTVVGTGPSVTLDPGRYASGFILRLQTVDSGNRTASASLTVYVGDSAPTCGTQKVCE